MAKVYKSVELVVKALGQDVLSGLEVLAKGARNAIQYPWMSVYVQDTERRECLAAHVEWLDESVFVSIPHKTGKGEVIPNDQYANLIEYASATYGVLIATSSGEKSGNYIALTNEAYERLRRSWEIAGRASDLPRFIQSVGLLFSSMTDNTAEVVTASVITPGHKYDRGQDGNGMCPREVANYSFQIRAMVQGDPTKVVKGIVSPTSPDGQWWIHHSQLKGTWAGEAQVTLLIIKNTGVTSEYVHKNSGKTSLRTGWLSSEVAALFKNNEETRRSAALKARDEAHKVLSLMQPDHRVELLDRWGGLKTDEQGKLIESKSAAIEALRCLPWVAELEALLGRFATKEIVRITHGAGVPVMASLIVQDSLYGASPLSYEEAQERVAQGKRIYCLYRVPATGAQALVWFGKNPYKRGIGFVVKPEAARLMDGDSDGDSAFMPMSRENTEFVLKSLDTRISGTGKPEKTPKPGAEINNWSIQRYWISQLETYGLVGRSTTLGWRLIRDNRPEEAVLAMAAANASPMMAKHAVEINGEKIADIIYRLSRAEADRLPVDENGKAIISPLNWREFKEFGKKIHTPRQFAEWDSSVESVLDACCVGVALMARKWGEKNQPISISEMRLDFESPEVKFSGEDARAGRNALMDWKRYWHTHTVEVDGERVIEEGDHSVAFNKIREAGSEMSRTALAWMLCHPRSPMESMTSRWAAMLDTHRGVEILGLHPKVEKALIARGVDVSPYKGIVKVVGM